jgi:SOS-response transcriptional repressor LexA
MVNRNLDYVYSFIYAAINRQGYPPTVQEIAASCHLSVDETLHLLEQLEQTRRITCTSGKPRGIRVVGLDRTWEQSDQVYAFIREYVSSHRFSPSLRDIATGCGLGLATIYAHLSELQADGRIRRLPGRARTITLPSSIAK